MTDNQRPNDGLVQNYYAPGVSYSAIGPDPVVNNTINHWHYHRPPTDLTSDLSRAHIELASVISERNKAEYAFLQLIDESPMPVEWAATDQDAIADPRTIFHDEGERQFDVRSDQPGKLCDKLAALRNHRLVVLGGLGAGKTVLIELLQREILRRVKYGYPIPVLLRLSRWDISQHKTLNDWLATCLKRDFPNVWRSVGDKMAQELIDQDRILPVLDGLDEVDAQVQLEIFRAVGNYLASHDSLVMASRTDTYTELVEEYGTLRATVVIESEGISPGAAADYLESRNDSVLEPWLDVIADLRSPADTPMTEICTSPLGLWLLQSVYSPISGGKLSASIELSSINERRVAQNDLLDCEYFPNAISIREHLFSHLIPAVLRKQKVFNEFNREKLAGYARLPRHMWDVKDSQRWLSYLASEDSIRLWDLPGISRGFLKALAFAGVTVSVAVCFFTALVGNVITISIYSAFGTMVGCLFMLTALYPTAYHDWSVEPSPIARGNFISAGRATLLMWPYFLFHIFVLTVYGSIGGVLWILLDGELASAWARNRLPTMDWSLDSTDRFWIATAAGFGGGALFELAGLFSIWFGLWFYPQLPHSYICEPGRCHICKFRTKASESISMNPRRAIMDTRLRLLLLLPVCMIASEIFIAFMIGGVFAERRGTRLFEEIGSADIFYWLLLASPFVAAIALIFAIMTGPAWLHFTAFSRLLALRGHLPWQLLDFLEDMHRVGLLRTSGAEFRFRHEELRKYLQDYDSSPVRSRKSA